MYGSPRSEQFDDIYFAVEDGFQETKHVFLAGNGLPERWQHSEKDRFVIAETGFGTGLNVLSAWQEFEKTARPDQHLHFISFEKYPLSAAQIKEYLSVWADQLGSHLDRLVETYPLRVTGWHSIQLTNRVSLLLIFDDVNHAMPELNTNVDAWFLDGHAPAKNPDMWSQIVFDGIGRNSATGATVATFTAAGVAKRGLREAGFKIEKRRGFGRKRDMIVGVFERDQPTPVKPHPKSVAIIGGGLAGTAVAHTLTSRGIACEIFEQDHLGAGASGNARGLFNPRFSAQRSADSDFYGAAYARAVATFNQISDIGFNACGSLHLVTDDDKRKRFMGLLGSWAWHPDHIQFLDKQSASDVAGIALEQDALYLPQSGSVDPSRVCKALAGSTQVHTEAVESLSRNGDQWVINGRTYDAVILANGAGCLAYPETSSLPLSTVRGQISYAAATPDTKKLKTNLCYGGYCAAPVEGEHAVGSTFQPWLTTTEIMEEDHQQIIDQLEQAVPAMKDHLSVNGGRAALRTAAKDRVAVIGKVPDQDRLYISTGHGSHGLLSALLAAEVIASDLNGEPQVLPQSVLDHIAPVRFQQRALKKTS